MKRQIIIGPLFVAALTCGVQPVIAESAAETVRGVGHPEECGLEGRVPHERFYTGMAKVLRLSADQQAGIREILNAERVEHNSLLKMLAENRKQFRQATHTSPFDETAVRTLAEKQAQLITGLLISPAIMRNKINSLLTPEQRDLEERIRPLLEQGPELRPPFPDGEFEPPMRKRAGDRPHMFEED
jgi:Spy/CpxP family protein refolding chaperone